MIVRISERMNCETRIEGIEDVIQKESPRSLMSSETLNALEAARASSPETILLALSFSSSASTPTSVVKWVMLSAISCALSEATVANSLVFCETAPAATEAVSTALAAMLEAWCAASVATELILAAASCPTDCAVWAALETVPAAAPAAEEAVSMAVCAADEAVSMAV